MKKKVLVISIIFAVLLSSLVYGKSDDPSSAAEDHAAAEDKTEAVLPYDSRDPEMAIAVIDIVEPYYESSKMIAINSPEEGRTYTDHKIEHALICTEKTLEAGQAIRESVLLGGLETEAVEGRIGFSADIDFRALEGAALSHDTGMNGNGYALTEAKDEDGNKFYEKDADGDYILHAEDNDHFSEIRSSHSLVSAMNILVNRQAYMEAGFTDEQVDEMAVFCMAHSKSNSGVRDLNSKENWKDCFDRLDSLVKYYNLDHEDAPISFDRTPFEQSDELLSSMVSGTLALRIGDVSRDSWENARAQSGEDVYVDRSTIDDYADNVEDELKDADITIGDQHDPTPGGKDRQVHAGEQNIIDNHTFVGENGHVTHEITVTDAGSAPNSTQEAINDHLGELYSARDGQFDVNIYFIGLNAEKPEHFVVSYEEYRIQAAQDYPNVSIHYPWDE